ncbi:DoxX family membrane protein [Streptomyces microflavus]|nr:MULTISPECIES: DoxX family membrane protein [Streptomyces]MEE1732671.1 DoxX family membrane protein [Streptomyces sp. BE282]QTA33657.1 DoxX family membrane protein [Streptomyces sp. CA-256286]WSR92922.1 DoxX family membrane protein [Streptomyces microflavus]WTF70820.1 DoxX family membrane protein [Streptomyces microflavus]
MSVDTRTPRFDEQPALSMTKVDSDPAQVIVNHASFRVQLAPGQRARLRGAPADTARIPAMSGAGGGRRRAPVVWSGRSAPGDPGATGLLQAVRNSTAGHLDTALTAGAADGHAAGATQVIPLLEETQPNPVLTAPQQTGRTGPLLPPMRQAVGAYDSVDDGPDTPGSGDRDGDGYDESSEARARRHGNDPVRHAYYPGHRMNLGVVLLPMRVLLGFISIYAGMGKLCDPVYFDGGERGSMVKWLTSLHPWALAEPLRDFALSHPVGAGLSVAFLQVVVGVLTVLGLWQRVAASVGALLSAALLVTVSWRTVAVYDAPDIILLAAWSPLIIAGAPVYSVDGRLAGEAWRRLGPRSEIWDLRRRVLRRGSVVASVVIGLTLLIGSILGGAVRSAEVVTVPGRNDYPTNRLPGQPLPQESTGERQASRTPQEQERRPEPTRSGAATTPADGGQAAPGATRDSGGGQSTGTDAQPSQTQGTGQEPPQQTTPQQPPAATSAGPTSSGSTGGDGSTGGGSEPEAPPASGGGEGSTSGGSSGGRNPIGGLLG